MIQEHSHSQDYWCPSPLAAQLGLSFQNSHECSLVICEAETTGVDYVIDPKPYAERFVVLAHSPSLTEYRDHFLIAACHQFERLLSSPMEDQLVPVRTRETLPREWEIEMRHQLGQDKREDRITRYSKQLYKGMLWQFTQLPTQIRIESELHDAYPQHREQQRAYLTYLADRELAVTDEVVEGNESISDGITSASLAMVLTAATKAAKMANIQTPDSEASDRAWGGTTLLEEALDEVPIAGGYLGDMAIIDSWAEIMNMRDWYEWRPLRTCLEDGHSPA